MTECPVCGEQGKLFTFWSGWVKGEDFQVEPEECQCDFCGFNWQQGQDLEAVIKDHLQTIEYRVECGEEELKWWKNFIPKIPRLTKVLAQHNLLGGK